MRFPLANQSTSLLRVRDETSSTNDELRALVASWSRDQVTAIPEFATVATLNQTAGRGRLGRTWVAPPGQALAASVLLIPGEKVPQEQLGWVPLIAGLAMTRAVRAVLDAARAAATSSGSVWLKWPNDVLISSHKVSGLLTELLPDGAGIVVGSGLNLTIPKAALPVPTATSLTLEGVTGAAADLADRALAAYLDELRALWGDYCDAGGDAVSSGILGAVSAECSTLGHSVLVSLPGGSTLVGQAVDLDESGQLRIRLDTDAALVTVAAGDITHLRYE